MPRPGASSATRIRRSDGDKTRHQQIGMASAAPVWTAFAAVALSRRSPCLLSSCRRERAKVKNSQSTGKSNFIILISR